MTAEEAAEIVRMALWEAGYPDARVMSSCPGHEGVAVSAFSAPDDVIHRAYQLLAHRQGSAYPEFDEWSKWAHGGPPWPTPWWRVAYEPVVVS